MRFYISSPCYIESDGPILIEPCPDSHTPPAESPETPKPINRRSHSRPHLRTCLFCNESFYGRNNQKYCSLMHKSYHYHAMKKAGQA